MVFLCDVHISIKFVKFIECKGHRCLHVNTILDSWFTKDEDISKYVDDNEMVLISKDIDFKNSHFVKKSPKNLSNKELIVIFSNILSQIEFAFINNNSFIIEVGKESTTITTS